MGCKTEFPKEYIGRQDTVKVGGQFPQSNNSFAHHTQSVEPDLKPSSIPLISPSMAPPKLFDFTGDVAIVTGAGSRMDGKPGGKGKTPRH
jgi:hypothetical protein